MRENKKEENAYRDILMRENRKEENSYRDILMRENKKEEYSYRNIYEAGKAFLLEGKDGGPSGNADASLDARLLLEEVCGTSLQTLLVYPDTPVSVTQAERYFSYLNRRKNHEPVAMILGRQEFMGMEFLVTRDVLIPEQDSEVLVETALETAQALLNSRGEGKADGRMRPASNSGKSFRVLDMCTGSGCLAVSFCSHLLRIFPDASVLADAADLSEKALAVAKENIRRHGLENVISTRRGNMFEAVSEINARYDMILSNPPYIAAEVIDTLPEEVRCMEPHMALDGGKDGLDFYRILAEKSPFYLRPNGIIITEIGYDQGESVPALFQEAGMRGIRVIRDYGGNERVVMAHAPQEKRYV